MKNMVKKLSLAFSFALTACGGVSAHPPAEVHRALAGPCAPTSGDINGQDECTTDAECKGGVCSCAPATREWSGGSRNVCVPANCHTDADCGDKGACSPTVNDCGSFYGVQGYYCHTAADACTVDAECVQGSNQGACYYAPEVGHWTCTYSHCAG
jgi:hypothetical protein